jgi:hypothetical protein
MTPQQTEELRKKFEDSFADKTTHSFAGDDMIHASLGKVFNWFIANLSEKEWPTESESTNIRLRKSRDRKMNISARFLSYDKGWFDCEEWLKDYMTK